MEESRNQRKSGAILSYLSIIISTIVQLIYTPFLIRMLGQSEYGLYSLVSSIIGYLTILDLGFGNAIIVYTAKYRAQKKYEEEKKLHGMFMIVFCVIGVIAALLGLFLYVNVNNIFGNTMTSVELEKTKIMMLILTFNLAITFPFSIYSSIISAYEKFAFQKIMSIINTLLKPLLMIPLLIIGYKSITMTLVITIINVLVLLTNYIYCKKKLDIKIKFQGFDKILFKTILGYSIWIFLGVIVDKINWSVDQFVLGAVSGTIAVSLYSVASQINTLFVNLSTAVSSVLLPKMSKMLAEKASATELTNEMIKVGRIQYYIIFFMASLFVIIGKDFIIWWAGKDFEEAYSVALILIIPLCFPLIQNLGLSIMQALNKYKFKSISTFIMAIFNVVISYFLAKKYGPVGSAIGTAIALIICNIFLINYYYYKSIGLNVLRFWKNIFKMTITFIPSVVVTVIFYISLPVNGFYKIILIGTLYTFLYIMSCYWVTFDSYEKRLVANVLKKLSIKGMFKNDSRKK